MVNFSLGSETQGNASHTPPMDAGTKSYRRYLDRTGHKSMIQDALSRMRVVVGIPLSCQDDIDLTTRFSPKSWLEQESRWNLIV